MVDLSGAFSAGVRKRELGFAMKQAQREAALEKDKLFNQERDKLTEAAVGIATAGREAGRSEEQIRLSVEALRNQLGALAETRGRFRFGTSPLNPEEEVAQALERFDAFLTGGVTPTEAATADARANVAGVRTTADALTRSGVPTTVSQTAQAAGLIPAPETPVSTTVINFRMPDGTIKGVDSRDSVAVKAALAKGGVKVTLGVQAEDISGLGVAGAPDEKRILEVREAITAIQGNMEEIQQSIKDFQETPEAGGLSGPVIEKLGGLVQQIPFIGEDIVEAAGVDPAEVKAVRTNARALAAQMLTVITKETSRFTDKEREIANEVLSTLDVTASSPQIQAALKKSLELMERSQLRQVNQLLTASGADLATEEGTQQFFDVLKANNFSDEQALDIIIDLQDRQGLGPLQ